jgi:hypothetical protein
MGTFKGPGTPNRNCKCAETKPLLFFFVTIGWKSFDIRTTKNNNQNGKQASAMKSF